MDPPSHLLEMHDAVPKVREHFRSAIEDTIKRITNRGILETLTKARPEGSRIDSRQVGAVERQAALDALRVSRALHNGKLGKAFGNSGAARMPVRLQVCHSLVTHFNEIEKAKAARQESRNPMYRYFQNCTQKRGTFTNTKHLMLAHDIFGKLASEPVEKPLAVTESLLPPVLACRVAPLWDRSEEEADGWDEAKAMRATIRRHMKSTRRLFAWGNASGQLYLHAAHQNSSGVWVLSSMQDSITWDISLGRYPRVQAAQKDHKHFFRLDIPIDREDWIQLQVKTPLVDYHVSSLVSLLNWSAFGGIMTRAVARMPVDEIAIDLCARPFGWSTRPVHGNRGLRVVSINPGSCAERAGVITGMELLAVNDEYVQAKTWIKLVNFLEAVTLPVRLRLRVPVVHDAEISTDWDDWDAKDKPLSEMEASSIRSLSGLPSSFFYGPPNRSPHTATGPTWVAVVPSAHSIETQCMVACQTWFSHAGLALTLLPLQFGVCIAIYLEDVFDISQASSPHVDTTAKSERVDAAVGAEAAAVSASATAAEVEGAADTARARIGPQFWVHITLRPIPVLVSSEVFVAFGFLTEVAAMIFASNVLEARMMIDPSFRKVVADRRMEKHLLAELDHIQHHGSSRLHSAVPSKLRSLPESTEPALVDLVPTAEGKSQVFLEDGSCEGYGTESRTRSDGCGTGSLKKSKWSEPAGTSTQSCSSISDAAPTQWSEDAYHERFKYLCAAADGKQLAGTANSLAAKSSFHFWSPHRLARVLLSREQSLPKLLRRVAPLTRVERYFFLCSAVQVGFFFMTFLFRADCQMAPKPAVCSTGGKAWYEPFLPTWTTFFGSLFGVMLAVPVPMILVALFRKFPRLEKLDDAHKQRQLLVWRIQTNFGWLFIFCLHLFVIYWLIIFSNNFAMSVFVKWGNAAIQSLLHRFISAPVLRGAVFFIVVGLGKYVHFMDHLLVFFPHILPVERLAGQPLQPTEAELQNYRQHAREEEDDDDSDAEEEDPEEYEHYADDDQDVGDDF
jgi:hypothetical protein